MMSRRIFFSLLFLIMTVNCARVVVSPRLIFGPAEARWVEKKLQKMTLEEKIGQMICCRYTGRFFNRNSDYIEELKSLVVEQKIGGFILSGGEVYETAHLTNSLQQIADIPLLIASDLERGLGNQIDGATLFPPLMSLGATDSEDLAYQMGKITAHEARSVGIHMTYSPVVDVNINPDNPIINTRSLGESPEQVSRLAVAFIRGCQENGLLATAKHFPGHGDTDLDSHNVLATIEGNRERLEKVELYPFQKSVEAGVQAVMVGHLRLPAFDSTPDLPASLSYKIVTGLLREELGFKGVIVTDAMEMAAVTALYSPEEAAVKAIKAGVDILLLPTKTEEVIQTLIARVRNGQISMTRIDDAVRRILEVKARLGLHKRELVNVEDLDEKIGIKKHANQALLTFENSITLVKNEEKVLPLVGTSQKIAVFSLSSDPDGYFAGRTFTRALKIRCPLASVFFADAFTGQEYIKEAIEKAKEAEVIVFALFSRLRAGRGSVDINLEHIELINDFSQGSKPVVVISFGSPYFLKHFPDVDAYLCAYRHSDPAQKAAVKAIFGEMDIKGKLPVSIPGLYSFGHGINLEKKNNKK